MREIKFRAWDDRVKTMASNTITLDEAYNRDPVRNTDNLIWMQYTGLKDKNGVEIYEGDIIDHESAIEPDRKFIAEIIYYTEPASFMMLNHSDSWKDAPQHIGDYLSGTVEVIGNIYENKELLK